VRTVPTDAAREDILAQFRYYALDQGVPDVGFRFLDAVEAAIARVGAMPAIGAPQYFDAPTLAGMRAWPVAAQFAPPAGRGQAVPEVLRGADPQSEHPQGVLPGGVAVCRLV
jgi:plasmid stabilization system protein ParE